MCRHGKLGSNVLIVFLALFGLVFHAPAQDQIHWVERNLVSGRWVLASQQTWNVLLRLGDRNRDGTLDYQENDEFPCGPLTHLMNIWRMHYHSSGGYDDILIPRFHQRAVSCGIWLR